MNDTASKLLRHMYKNGTLEQTDEVREDTMKTYKKFMSYMHLFLDKYEEMSNIRIGVNYLVGDRISFIFPRGVLLEEEFLTDLGDYLNLEQEKISGYTEDEYLEAFYYEVVYHILDLWVGD